MLRSEKMHKYKVLISTVDEYEVSARDIEEAGDIAMELADSMTHFWNIDSIEEKEK